MVTYSIVYVVIVFGKTSRLIFTFFSIEFFAHFSALLVKFAYII